jgi:hypothetical protein
MRRIREVLRLKHECALFYGQIAQALRLSKGTVSNYLIRAEAAGITHELAQGLDDAGLLSRLQPQRYVYRRFAAPDFASVHRELNKKGVTLQLLWEEYRESAQGSTYSRSRFCERYAAFVGTLKRSMRQTHVAGEKLFVDFAGQTVPIYNAAGGEDSRAHIFVTCPAGSKSRTAVRRPRTAGVLPSGQGQACDKTVQDWPGHDQSVRTRVPVTSKWCYILGNLWRRKTSF